MISFVRSPLPNANGWNNTDVTVTFTCTDSGSGLVASLAAPQVVTFEGAAQTRSGTLHRRRGQHDEPHSSPTSTSTRPRRCRERSVAPPANADGLEQDRRHGDSRRDGRPVRCRELRSGRRALERGGRAVGDRQLHRPGRQHRRRRRSPASTSTRRHRHSASTRRARRPTPTAGTTPTCPSPSPRRTISRVSTRPAFPARSC